VNPTLEPVAFRAELWRKFVARIPVDIAVGPCGTCGAFHYASHASTSSPWMGVCLLRCVWETV
jgi:hypothetical protein